MSKIDFKEDLKYVEKYEFEPIKGYPMLNWNGKRPFRSTQFYPAQLKEQHGEEVNGWLNEIFWGDNLQVMSHLLKKYRGKVDLICIDPPYDSKADYKKTIKLKGQIVVNDKTSFEEKQYTDIWTNDEYLQFMYERLILMKELLSDTGSIYLHCDWHKVHHLRCIMDEIFGANNFQNEIIWCYKERETSKRCFNKKHDNILFYTKNLASKYTFNFESITETYSEVTVKKFKYTDNEGRKYRLRGKDGTSDPAIEDENSYRQYLDEATGPLARDWFEMAFVNQASNEREDYPTQKPEALIEKFIKASTNPGDLVFDCFMGSGTTQATAMKLGRRFIGADINLGAIQTTTKRLINIGIELKGKLQDEIRYTGFSIYNVNNYDIFNNPLEAKKILLEALEVEILSSSSLWDGIKDGRKIKIMPSNLNRIATRADLSEILSNIEEKDYKQKFDKSPNKVVDEITLVCMGHEPDLAAYLEEQLKPFKMDIEVVDILRDKANLQFKRDAEADIRIVKDKLVIKSFYPMNLMQKLSLDKTKVTNWKELTESVMIDFNYDGSVFTPIVVDISEQNGFVKGEYKIPNDAGTICVKITDLLSESFIKELNNG